MWGDAEVEQFEEGHPVSLWVPLYDFDEEHYQSLALFYYDEAEEEWVELDSVIDGDFLKAETAHWSYSALMGGEEPTLPETGMGFMWLVPLGLLLLLAGVVVRKRVAA